MTLLVIRLRFASFPDYKPHRNYGQVHDCPSAITTVSPAIAVANVAFPFADAITISFSISAARLTDDEDEDD